MVLCRRPSPSPSGQWNEARPERFRSHPQGAGGAGEPGEPLTGRGVRGGDKRLTQEGSAVANSPPRKGSQRSGARFGGGAADATMECPEEEGPDRRCQGRGARQA
jgi:hypothetical protein